MRLITKKCPNCGANLSFNENDTKIKCEYCKQDIFIERDKKHFDDFNEEAYQLSLEAFQKVGTMNKGTFYGAFIFIIIVIIVICFISFSFFKTFRLFMNDTVEKVDIPKPSIKDSSENSNMDFPIENLPVEKGKVTEINQINEKSLTTLKKDSLEILNKWSTSLQSSKVTNWEYVGMYLLIPKSIGFNELYMVYKRKYTVRNKQIEAYGAVSYTDIKLKGEDISLSSTGFPIAPMKNDGNLENLIYGYESNEAFYNTEIKSKNNQYEVKATKGMYLKN